MKLKGRICIVNGPLTYDGRLVKQYYVVDATDKERNVIFQGDDIDELFRKVFRLVEENNTDHKFLFFADFGDDEPLRLVQTY